MNLFIMGTDTGVGKTVVSVVLALKLGYQYWKPIQSGCEDETDSDWAARFLGAERVLTETYRLQNPLSPHESARRDGISIDVEKIVKSAPVRSTVIEGVGGLLTPLNEKSLLVDLMLALSFSTILVARSGLGTINHTLLTIEALQLRKLNLLGVILVGHPNPANGEAIEFYGKTQILGIIPMIPTFSRATLTQMGKNIYLEEKYGTSHQLISQNHSG